MNDRNLNRGLFLIALALLFGVPAFNYQIGSFAHAGPGLFPAMVSGMLLAIGVITVIRSRFVKPVPMSVKFKNIGIILASLCSFALVSTYLNMTVGIVVMVFIASLAASGKYSWLRNVKVAVVLVAFAFGFQKLLGLNLPLY
ncbi:tripartite tricarboxylate transporter TctB family protein [Pseudacidovorax intermedius]|uniref:Tripartite tricarboxylate transporter TctB n=1 Tax=Pseudacidovorax intermedius TaxID=433924 RepID=A0A147GQT5_9BURK|nr:tripartite tricarboxylate transporter TctB family protein [Pseudacidovorax intermedius]KTT18397.1 tripartite tricarboxylate transporter TctB [Pseudacidovorax intermedius]